MPLRPGPDMQKDKPPFLQQLTGKEKTVAKKDDNFIMLPTVDVCFKGLMYNPKVRKGFIAALLKADPASVRETILLPTALRQEYPDEKLGILDVRTMMEDGAQINMEMQVESFKHWDARSLFYLSKMYTEQLNKGDSYEKLKKCIHVSILDFVRFAKELQSDNEVIRWMRFLAGKTRKEFEEMAGTSEYIEEAYRELERMSADERARLEYEARQKAIRDHDAIMKSAWENGLESGMKQGLEQGLEQGMEQGLELGRQSIIQKMLDNGASPEEIMGLTGATQGEVEKAQNEAAREL